VDGRRVIKHDDDIVTFDRQLTVTTLDAPFFQHIEGRVHHECHDQGTIAGKLIAHRGVTTTMDGRGRLLRADSAFDTRLAPSEPRTLLAFVFAWMSIGARILTILAGIETWWIASPPVQLPRNQRRVLFTCRYRARRASRTSIVVRSWAGSIGLMK
jgi:hypothetical protein